MDISRLTPEEIRLLTPDQIELTPEQRELLTPEQVAAALETLSDDLRLTPEEQQHHEAAVALMDGAAWREFAQRCVKPIVESYRRGDFADERGALVAMHRATIGCLSQHRLHLLGVTAALLLRIEPVRRTRGQRSQPWPFWLQRVTAALVLEGQERSGLRRTPTANSDPNDEVSEPGAGTSSPIAWALEILTRIGLFSEAGAPQPSTVDDWVRALLQELASAARRS
jgi:hypothetical protein